jgi:eukaryotic-like serine/threonine-protein kinase
MKREWIKAAFILFFILIFSSCATTSKEEKAEKGKEDKPQIKQVKVDSAEDFYNKGMDEFKKGDFDEAVSDFKTAVKMDDKHYKAYYALGQTYEKLNKDKEAEESYEQAIKIKSDYLPALEGLGLVCFKQKKYLQAEKGLKPARALGSKNPEIYYAFGEIEQRENECKFAQILFKQALSLNPDYQAARNGLAAAEQACKQKQQRQQQPQQQQRTTTPPRY